MATETFQTLLLMIQNSGINYKMEVCPFSATICIKNSLLKDKNGNPLISQPMSNKNYFVKSEGHNHATDILKQESVIEALQNDYENVKNENEKANQSNEALKETIDILHIKLETAEHETFELRKEKAAEVANYAATENYLKKKLILLQAENEALKETAFILTTDLDKKSTDYLALSRKLNAEHLKHQKQVKEFNDFCDPLILEERKLRRKETSTRKKNAKDKKVEKVESLKETIPTRKVAKKVESDPSLDNDDLIIGDENFLCSLCAQIFLKSEMSTKLAPEESDSCMICNQPEPKGKVEDRDPQIKGSDEASVDEESFNVKVDASGRRVKPEEASEIEVEENKGEGLIDKEKSAFGENYFPVNFKDWSEEQKKEAHDNNYKFYVEKYLGSLNI